MEGLDCQEIRAVTPTTAHLLPELLEFPPDAEMNNERDVWAVVATAIELGRNQDGTLGAHLERFKRGGARSRIQAAIVWKASNSVLLQQTVVGKAELDRRIAVFLVCLLFREC